MGGSRPDRAESLPVWAGTVDRGSRGMGDDLCGEMHVKPLKRSISRILPIDKATVLV